MEACGDGTEGVHQNAAWVRAVNLGGEVGKVRSVRLRVDMINIYKIMRGGDMGDCRKPIPISDRTRIWFRTKRFEGEMRKTFFIQRMVSTWNALSDSMVEVGCEMNTDMEGRKPSTKR